MLARFWKQQSGSAVEFFAIGGVLVAAAALFVGYSAQELAREGDFPTVAFLSPDQYVAKKSKSPSFNAIDYSATGSVRGQTIILDPCTGLQKSQ
jgi:hypothetical protein